MAIVLFSPKHVGISDNIYLPGVGLRFGHSLALASLCPICPQLLQTTNARRLEFVFLAETIKATYSSALIVPQRRASTALPSISVPFFFLINSETERLLRASVWNAEVNDLTSRSPSPMGNKNDVNEESRCDEVRSCQDKELY